MTGGLATMARTGYRRAMRTTLPLALLLTSMACTSETGVSHDTGGQATLFMPAPPQLVACTRVNCCAILHGGVGCIGSDDSGLTSGAPAGFGWVGIESADRWLCVWDSGGTRECWGDEEHAGPLVLAYPSAPMADMRFGTAGGISLGFDGSLSLWGSDYYGQISAAPELTEKYIAIEAGLGWFAAVDRGGELHVWGIEAGEGPGDAIAYSHVTQAPPSALRLRSLDYGTGDVLCGVTVSDELVCWGGGTEHTGALQGLEARGVAPSANYSCAHLPSGLLACAGELIPPFEVGPEDALTPPTVPVIDAACSHRLCCAILDAPVEGLECWGEGQAL